jgi:signal transduction histidine kinase
MEASPLAEEVRKAKERNDIDYILQDFDAIMAESEDGFRRITDIVQNLKSFSRIESSERFEAFDINKGIETTLSVARNEVKYIAEVKLELAALPLVECVGGEVNQVLLNLVMNAAQAIKGQGRTEKGTIEVRTGVRDDWVWIEIKDDGPGIPKSLQLRIFDAFYTTKPVGQGTGLGLSISSDIVVHRHGGRLTVESEPGKGACFRVELPVIHREAQVRPAETSLLG